MVGQIFGAASWLSVRDALAQIYHQTSRMADAKAVDDELHVLLAVADADHPIKRRLNTRSTDTAPAAAIGK